MSRDRDDMQSTDIQSGVGETAPRPSLIRRMWPLGVLAAAIATVFLTGWHEYLSLETLREQREALVGFVDAHFLVAFLAFIAVYVLVTAFMVPGALWVTISGGFLFGVATGSLATIIGATIGACILFVVARTSLGAALHERAGPFVRRMEAGFKKDAIAYMFALRFLPIVPFPVANIAPALLGARLLPFFITTAVGVTPGVIAYTWLGAGLGAVFDAGETLDVGGFFKQLAPAFALLALVSLLPPIVKRIMGKKAPQVKSEEVDA